MPTLPYELTATVPPRSAIPDEYKWNAASVYPDDAAWEAELKDIQANLGQITAFQGRLKEGPAVLFDALQIRDQLVGRAIKAMMYAYFSHEVDKGDQAKAGMPGKAQGIVGQAMAASAFINPELIELGHVALKQWMQAEPRLAVYAHVFDNLFRAQAHVRSTEVEELLGMLSDPLMNISNTASVLTDADLVFKPTSSSQGQTQPMTQGDFFKNMSSPDRTLRQSTWENYMDGHLAMKNTLASNMVTSLKANVFLSRARRHESTLQASLFEDNIPVEVFHNLIDTFRKNLPIWHRYFQVRRKALGVEQLEPYDLWAPLTAQRPQIPFFQAVEWICAGLTPMGQEYVDVLRRGCLEQRWVDVYPNQNKNSGAFSYGTSGTHPFILISYTNDILSLSTLAHELGHSMHSYLTWKTQPLVYSDYSLFAAEVASNFHQAMVRGHLLEKEKDRNFQISLIEEAMANFLRYFLIMPTLARFELETHRRAEEGDAPSAEQMNDLMADLFSEAYGGHVHVDRQRVGITWATFSHLYSDYYVYQYATGISGANALARRILAGEPGAAEAYLGFLKSGSSLYPLDALKRGGVDLTTPRPVEETFAVMSGYIDRLEKLL